MPKSAQNMKSETEKVVNGPQQITNAWTKPFAPSMKHSSSTCTQENNGGRHGRYQRTYRIDDNVVHNNGPSQGHRHSSGRGGKFVSRTGLSQGNHNFLSDMREHDGVVPNQKLVRENNSGHSCSTSGQSTTPIRMQRSLTHIKLVH